MLAGLDEARKREILDHLAIVAKADGEVDARERRLLEATANRRLGFRPEPCVQIRGLTQIRRGRGASGFDLEIQNP
jgi:uncharacterized tellurite resistance protein B-like protein